MIVDAEACVTDFLKTTEKRVGFSLEFLVQILFVKTLTL